jgi:hypothetical protein
MLAVALVAVAVAWRVPRGPADRVVAEEPQVLGAPLQHP